LSRTRLAEFAPDAGRQFETPADANFDAIAKQVCEGRPGRVTLSGADQSFWVLDLKRLFPGVKLEVRVATEKEAKRAIHLRRFIDSVQFADPAIRKVYEDFLLASDGPPSSRRSCST
jgi:hypothetical protein